MERLTEERLTKFLISYLKSKDFKIFSYDFPQSGTGYALRPNSSEVKHKNIKFWIPDIIAIKEERLYLFENKDHFSLSDIRKINQIFLEGSHSEALIKLLEKTQTKKLFVVLAYPLNYFKELAPLDENINAEIGCDILNEEIQLKTNCLEIRHDLINENY